MPNPENIKEHEFKPGQSGNPNGRPKGISLTTTLRKMLDREIEITDPISQEKKRTKIGEIINLKLLAKAMKGDTKAIDMVFDRIEGKPLATHAVDTGINLKDLLGDKYEERMGGDSTIEGD